VLAVLLALALALVDGPRAYTGTREVTAPVEPAPTLPDGPTPPEPPHRAGPGNAPGRPSWAPSALPRRAYGEVHARWFTDAAIVLATLVPVQILSRVVAPRQALEPLPGEPNVGRVDRVALHRFSTSAAHASDALLAIGLVAVPTLTMLHGRWASRRGAAHSRRAFVRQWLGVALVDAEAIGVTLLLTQALKQAVARPRPFTSLSADEVASSDRAAFDDAIASPDRQRSFPSGHASTTFAAVTALATALTIEHPRTKRSRAVVAVVWVAGMATAATVATLRVVAGKHYPSDVAAGSALGFGVGAAVPLLHTCWLRGGYGRRTCATRR